MDKTQDDLDSYLDDVLEEFESTSIQLEPPQPAQATGPPFIIPEKESEISSEVFENQEQFMKLLQENMAKLMEEAGNGNGGFSELSELSAVAPASEESKLKDFNPKEPKNFQDNISQTLSKMKNSSSEAEAKLSSTEDGGIGEAFLGDDAAMEQMMKELEGMMGTGEFDEMFGGLVDQLASKDLLYEPMKDLAKQYPLWLENNEEKISKDEADIYRKQYVIVKEIVEIFDGCETSEPNEQESQKIIDLMQKMQEYGNPPEDLMKELVPAAALESATIPSECKQM